MIAHMDTPTPAVPESIAALTALPWRPPIVELAHPQGTTIVAAIDYHAAIIHVEQESDVPTAQAWIDDRRALHQAWAERGHAGGSGRPFPDWRVDVAGDLRPIIDRLIEARA